MNRTIKLAEIASTRSGDKGNHANLGVVARNEAAFVFLRRVLTPALVANYFADLGATRVERYELPRVAAFNFVLVNALAGGASQSLRIDTQGKLLGAAAAEMELTVDEADMAQLVQGGWRPTPTF